MRLLNFASILLPCLHVLAAFPQVDFDRMGTVGLAGAFAGLDVFQNRSLDRDPSASTLLERSFSGALSPLATTNTGGLILAACLLDDVFYIGGSFTSINDVSASNAASFSNSSRTFSALGSNSPNGRVDTLFCDQENGKVWAGGSFSAPGENVAIYDVNAGSWSSPPFSGLSGAGAHVHSITTNSSGSSVFIAGSFIAAFQGNGGNLTGSNNPNVPYSPGATPFSSSLVPVPLVNAEVTGSPSTSDSDFSDISVILCPTGDDGPGNTWLAADNNEALVTVRTFSFISAFGVRLGNTFVSNHGTTRFSVATIPDNTVRALTYFDPATNENLTCTDSCPLSTDSSILYQDFLFDSPQTITGVEIRITGFTGSSAGLHLLQLLSSGASAASVDEDNGQACFAPNPSTTSRTGDWTVIVANTDISGTTQSVLVSTVDVGTPSSEGPTFTWRPYVSASGQYQMSLLVPGCTNFQDCGLRTSVKVTVFPGNDLPPVVTTVSQTNGRDEAYLIYSGPILPSSPDFVTVITMALADDPEGSGEGGQYELVADRVQLVLTSADLSSSGGSDNRTLSNGAQGSRTLFGFFEWPLDFEDSVDATQILPNSTETGLDDLGIDLGAALGGTTSLSASSNAGIAAVAHHSSGTIFIGGNFSLSSGSASGSGNVVAYRDGAFAGMADNGLNGPVTSLVIAEDRLFVGGAFTDTTGGSSNAALQGVALYNIQDNTWSALGNGVNGAVTSLAVTDGKVQVAGNFTQVFDSSSSALGKPVSGLAVWDTNINSWVSSGGFVVGSMSMVSDTDGSQLIAGNIRVSTRYGATGMVYLASGDDEGPSVTPLSLQLQSQVGASSSPSRRHFPRAPSWLGHTLTAIFARQSSSLPALPQALPAPAPAVLAGAFWTNSSDSNTEVTILGGNFSFPSGSGQAAQNVAIFNPEQSTMTALQGEQINGVVHALLVDGNNLYIGGQFSISGQGAAGFAVYDLIQQEWASSGIQPLQPSSGSTVVVRSITKSASDENAILVAGSFAQAGALPCTAICSLDTSSKQWNALGSGVQGEISSIAYSGDNQENLIAGGSLALSDSSAANVAQYVFSNSSWTALGSGSDIPGPVTALEVNNLNGSSIFAAGRAADGGSTFLVFWNGAQWSQLGAGFGGDTIVSQLAMVPLEEDHDAQGVIEANRMLMVSGSLSLPSFGDASSALFDGQSMIPYIVSATTAGAAGSVAALFHSFTQFDFSRRKFLAVGIVILISIAIAAGVVFLLALIGILWTLFARRDDKLGKLSEVDDDDDSTHHRPSSLLEHINAATRTTILGPAGNYSPELEEEKIVRNSSPLTPEPDPFAADAGGFARADTPSDAVGGLGTEESGRPAHVRYSFDGAGEGELPISAGAEVEVLDDRDPAWWYARDLRTGREGVVPAAYLY